SGETVGGGWLSTLPLTSVPAMVGSLYGLRFGCPLASSPWAHTFVSPSLLVTTSLRVRPLNGMSTMTGVCVESQSCVSWGEVWKYHFILPLSTSTASSDDVKRLSPSPRPWV